MERVKPDHMGQGRFGAGADERTQVDESREVPSPTPTLTPAPPATPSDEMTAVRPELPVWAMATPLAGYVIELGPGAMLGEYRIEGLIGEGGMGSVFAAVHPLIGKRAAIKVLHQQLCTDPQAVERFLNEARIVNAIGHRNIVDIFAFGATADGRSYLVMEFLRGQTLRTWLATRRLTLPEVCAVLRPLARALEAAHAKGVIHRDLKPDNVFLVDDQDQWLVKLLDFGIAKLARLDRDIGRTATGAMIGTPQYIAPEQARGRAIDHRVDIYSLGGVAFELLTGRSAFVADNAMEVIAKHLMEAPVAPSSLAPVPAELDRLVLAMLAKDADLRPSLAEVSAVLDRAAQLPGQHPIDRGPRSSAPGLSGPERAAAIVQLPTLPGPGRRSLRAIWIAACVVVAGILVVAGVGRWSRAGRARTAAVAASPSSAVQPSTVPPPAATSPPAAAPPPPAAPSPAASPPAGAPSPAASPAAAAPSPPAVVPPPAASPSAVASPPATSPSSAASPRVDPATTPAPAVPPPRGDRAAASPPATFSPVAASSPAASPAAGAPSPRAGASPPAAGAPSPRAGASPPAAGAPSPRAGTSSPAASPPAPSPRVAPAAPPAPHAVRPPVRDIKLQIAPAAAVVRLDAVIVGDGIAHVPLDGHSHKLSLTAPGFEPQTVLLNGATPTSLRIALAPNPLPL